MTAYRIKYQTRRRNGISIPQGNWLDKEKVVLAGEDANEIVNTTRNHDFRLKGVEIITSVDIINFEVKLR